MSVCVIELANKEQEEQDEVKSNVDSDVHSPSHSIPDGHTSDQSQSSDVSQPEDTLNDRPPTDHLTWNGTLS